MQYRSFHESRREEEPPMPARIDRHLELRSVTEMLSDLSSLESVSDARHVLIRMLQDTLRHRIHRTLCELYQDALKLNPDRAQAVVRSFQDNLKSIENWSARILAAEVAEIRQKRPDLDEIIEGAFVSTCMVLASVRGQNDDEVRLPVPHAEAFVHECYILVGQEVFGSPFLYTDANSPEVYVTYRQSALGLIDRCIETAVLQRLSVQPISQRQRRPSPPPQRMRMASPPLTTANLMAHDAQNLAPEDSISQPGRRPMPEPEPRPMPSQPRPAAPRSERRSEPQAPRSRTHTQTVHSKTQSVHSVQPQLRDAQSEASHVSQQTFERALRRGPN